MGAVPGDGLLTPDPAGWFDVEPFRRSTRRRVVVRRADRRAVVLGSTQPGDVVDTAAAAARGVAVVRRRSGGGAVHLQPDDPVWVDLWVPRGDPLWDDDVHAGAGWVGRWWAATLHSLGGGALSVHRGPSTGGEWSGVVCFAGVGPAEVTAGERKVVGIAQWRAREGALFHSAAYLRWDPAPLAALVAAPADERRRMADGLATVAVGLADLLGRPAGTGLRASVTDRLLELLPGDDWDVEG